MNHNLMRRAQSVLATGLLLGGMFAATAQTLSLPPQTNQYRLASNYASSAVAPYNSGGGVPAQSIIYTPIYNQITTNYLITTNAGPPISYTTNATYYTNNNTCTLNWYGTYGYYTVLGATSALGPWTAVASVVSTNFACKVVLSTTNSSSSFFQLSQANGYAGSDQCSSCHGDKYGGYKKTTHAGVYSNPGAVANFSLACLTVGYGQPTGFVDPSTNANLENVGCENCHGPAGWHKNSDHDVILPVVSQDPAICGSCHQGPLHPIFQEYTNLSYTIYTNKLTPVITTNIGPPISYQTNSFTTNVVAATDPATPIGLLTTGRSHAVGSHSGACSICHLANNRMVMVKEYYDNKAGSPHPLTLFPSSFAGAMGSVGAAACATCHDPHGSNNVAQLRYPISSTNYNNVVPLLLTTTQVITNYNGTFTTNTLTMNNVFDQYFNPKVQVCGQCHSGGGGIGGASPRWDGSTFGFVTNLVASTVTNTVYVDITTNVTVTQVFSNAVPPTTNSYTYSYVVGRYATNVVTTSTNPVIGVGIYYPLIAYTNGGTTYYSSNSLGDYAPHYPVQYNVVIGQLNDDLAARGGPANVLTDPHTLAPNQCADCHVPSYVVNTATNVTGHSFVSDNNGCLASCHSALTSAQLVTKTFNSKAAVSNSMDRVASLLKQWGTATNVAPNILRTNYGTCAWDYPSVSTYFGSKSTNSAGVKFLVGPPKAYNPALGSVPSGTNDNLQLAYVPQDIRIARFSLYWIYEDQSYGVHNPTYVKSLLADAEARVMNQFITNNYPAVFSASATSGTGSLTVNFSNNNVLGSTYAWNFGDGTGVTNSTPNTSHTYATGLYSVTCTVDGNPLTRTKYISVQ